MELQLRPQRGADARLVVRKGKPADVGGNFRAAEHASTLEPTPHPRSSASVASLSCAVVAAAGPPAQPAARELAASCALAATACRSCASSCSCASSSSCRRCSACSRSRCRQGGREGRGQPGSVTDGPLVQPVLHERKQQGVPHRVILAAGLDGSHPCLLPLALQPLQVTLLPPLGFSLHPAAWIARWRGSVEWSDGRRQGQVTKPGDKAVNTKKSGEPIGNRQPEHSLGRWRALRHAPLHSVLQLLGAMAVRALHGPALAALIKGPAAGPGQAE